VFYRTLELEDNLKSSASGPSAESVVNLVVNSSPFQFFAKSIERHNALRDEISKLSMATREFLWGPRLLSAGNFVYQGCMHTPPINSCPPGHDLGREAMMLEVQ